MAVLLFGDFSGTGNNDLLLLTSLRIHNRDDAGQGGKNICTLGCGCMIHHDTLVRTD